MMSRFLRIATSVVLGCTLITSYIIYAQDTNNTLSNDPSNGFNVAVSKDEWLNGVKPYLPALVCKGFEIDPQLKLRLDAIQMTSDKCIAAIPDSINKCIQQYYSDIPSTINNDSAAKWGKTLGECIGKDFVVTYLLPKNDQ